MIRTLALTTSAALVLAASAHAGVASPFTENFDSDSANWFNSGGGSPLDWSPTGSYDGGAYATTSLEVPLMPPPFGLTVFRAQDEFGSSGGGFEGDWIAGGITELRFQVRHNAAVPVSMFSRIASPNNFPSAVGLAFEPILPNTWTEVVIDVSEGSPQLILAGAEYSEVFSNIGHLQFGFEPTDAVFGQTIQFDIDAVQIVPAPGAFAVLGGFALVAGRRRRRG